MPFQWCIACGSPSFQYCNQEWKLGMKWLCGNTHTCIFMRVAMDSISSITTWTVLCIHAMIGQANIHSIIQKRREELLTKTNPSWAIAKTLYTHTLASRAPSVTRQALVLKLRASYPFSFLVGLSCVRAFSCLHLNFPNDFPVTKALWIRTHTRTHTQPHTRPVHTDHYTWYIHTYMRLVHTNYTYTHTWD